MPALLSAWWKRFPKCSAQRSEGSARAPRSFRPAVLLLESRLAPAVMGGAGADHVYSASDGASLAADVQAANGQSGSSQIILTTPGTYSLSSTLNISSNLTITGLQPGRPDLYVLQPGAGVKDRVLDISGGHNVVLNGLTIQGGSTNGDGGGIDVTGSGARLVLENTMIEDNSAAGSGGGVAVADGAELRVADSFIMNNTADGDGGGIAFQASSQSATVNLQTTFFLGNKASTGDGGGIVVKAMSPSGSSASGQEPNIDLTVNFTSFLGNTSGHDGGGLWASDVNRLSGNAVFAFNNTSVQDAGAVGDSVADLNSASFAFTNSYIAFNQVTGPGSENTTPDAGGICFDFTNASATGNVRAVTTGNILTNNSVAGAGGGAYVRDEAGHTRFDSTFSGNYVANNHTSLSNIASDENGEGGGLYLRGSAASNQLSVSGNTFLSNTAASNGGGLFLRLDTGKADVSDNSFFANHASNNGGGIGITGNNSANIGGTVNLNRDSLYFNAAGADGGGVFVDTTGHATLNGDMISFNQASTTGGGVYNNGGTVRLDNSDRIADNMPNESNVSGT
jgi:hypothetical protein